MQSGTDALIKLAQFNRVKSIPLIAKLAIGAMKAKEEARKIEISTTMQCKAMRQVLDLFNLAAAMVRN